MFGLDSCRFADSPFLQLHLCILLLEPLKDLRILIFHHLRAIWGAFDGPFLARKWKCFWFTFIMERGSGKTMVEFFSVAMLVISFIIQQLYQSEFIIRSDPDICKYSKSWMDRLKNHHQLVCSILLHKIGALVLKILISAAKLLFKHLIVQMLSMISICIAS